MLLSEPRGFGCGAKMGGGGGKIGTKDTNEQGMPQRGEKID